MKKVLFPFEINQDCYREAYVYAVKVTRNLGAELIMLNAFEIEVDDTITPQKYDLIIRNNWVNAYREIILFHDYYLHDHARVDTELRVKVDHRIVNGKIVEEFRKIIHSEKIDLVVLPASDRSEKTNKKLKLMRRETLEMNLTSLLAIPSEKTYKDIHSILFLTGLKRLKGIEEYLCEISLFASVFNSSIHFLQLSRHERDGHMWKEESIRTAQVFKSIANRIFFHTIIDRNPGNAVKEYISGNNIRLIALVSQQLHIIGDIFPTGLFEEMCVNAGIPVLILKESYQA